MAPRIVVVDDDLDILCLLHDALALEGYSVAGASNTDTALAALAQELPALVILDLWLDARDAGWRLLERLRADPATAHLPVIVSSADAISLRAQEAALRDLGCAVVEKPFDLDDLFATIARFLDHQGRAHRDDHA
jgi:two-component system nitrogen regulation response regulator NtrX